MFISIYIYSLLPLFHSQIMPLICCSVDRELGAHTVHIGIGPMLQEQVYAVQISRASSVIQDGVSIGSLCCRIAT